MTTFRLLKLSALLWGILPFSASAQDSSIRYSRIQQRLDLTGNTEILALPVTKVSDKAVLMGYTDKPVPADAEMPDGLKYWLSEVERGSLYAEQHPEVRFGTDALSQTSTAVISPLLGGIEWSQSAPYNALCPKGTPVGCVATAMAQVMYYWKYPAQGSDSHSWSYNGINHYVDFGATTYDWDLMFDKYSSNHTEEQKAEVAKLSYHCGVSVDMMYDAGGSGSYTPRVAYALQHYFGYNSRIGSLLRRDYSYYDWNEILISELQAGRPVIFSGTSETGGHAFVIDGRDSRGFYHVNWGWNGSYNGYYDICILNPEGTGTGASPSANGFSANQDIIVQCCPYETGKLVSPLQLEGIWFNFFEGKIRIRHYYSNIWNGYIHTDVGLRLINVQSRDTTYQFNESVKFAPLYTWEDDNGHSAYYYSNQELLLSYPADGDYEIFPCYRWNDMDSLIMIPSTDYYGNKEVYATYRYGRWTSCVQSSNPFPYFNMTCLTELSDTLALGKPYDVTYKFTNDTEDRFSGYTYFLISNPNNNRNSYKNPESELTLEPGESKTITLTLQMDKEGLWICTPIIGSRNLDQEWGDMSYYHYATFTEDSPGEPYLITTPTVLTEHPEAGGMASFQFEAGNKGGNFGSQMQIKVFKTKACTGNAVLTISQDASLPMLSEGETVTVTGTLTGLKGMTKYFILPYYRDVHGQSQKLYYIDPTVKVSPVELKVYSPAGIETIECDEPASAPAYDLFGRPATQGTFLIRKGEFATYR